MEEIWKAIPNYEEGYIVSSIGRVKSLERIVATKGGFKTNKERILKAHKSKSGYYFVALCLYGKKKQYYIHQLMAMAFLGHVPNKFKLVVDHINNDKTDNRIDNLRIVTNRENSSQRHLKSSSKYVGVRQAGKRWRSSIRVGKKRLWLGTFDTEYEAHLAYQNKLKEING